jgi:hypothetical protein
VAQAVPELFSNVAGSDDVALERWHCREDMPAARTSALTAAGDACAETERSDEQAAQQADGAALEQKSSNAAHAAKRRDSRYHEARDFTRSVIF